MSEPTILLTRPLVPAAIMDAMESAFHVRRLGDGESPGNLSETVRESVTAVVTTGGFGASADLIDALPKLRLIACYGVGVDAVDLDAAARRDIAVTNTPDVLTDDVADMAVALWVALGRGLVSGDRWLRGGRWVAEGGPPLTHSLGTRTVGFLGFGRIGQAIAARIRPFGCKILYHKRRPLAESEDAFVPELRELAHRSDDLVVCCSGGEATRELVNADVLSALGEGGRLINIARGSVVDERALIELLRHGRLAGAALDVFADEPNVPEVLRGLDNVVLTPHIGSATVETRQAMGELVLANLHAHFRGEPLITPIR